MGKYAHWKRVQYTLSHSVNIIYYRYCLSLLGAIHVVLQDNPRIFGFLWRICELLKAIVLWITNGLFVFFLVLTFLTGPKYINVQWYAILNDVTSLATDHDWSCVHTTTETCSDLTCSRNYLDSFHPEGVLGLIFAGCEPLGSQSPYPIIVYFVTNYRPHHFWSNM